MPYENKSNPPPGEHPEPGQIWSDALARWYVDNYGEHPTSALAVDIAALEGSETVVDIGCGSGSAVRAAASKLTTGKAIGIDPTPAMIRIAKEQSRSHEASARMQFFEAPAEELPLEDTSVDVAIAIGSLHHWADIAAGLGEIARVLKPGGRLIVVEDIFDEPDMGMSHETIGDLIDASPLTITDSAEHTLADGRARVFLARKGDST